jgi:hypothetical protein
MMNTQLHFFVDQKNPSFKVLRAKKLFSEGDMIIDFKMAEECSEPDYMSIDLGSKHVYHPMGRYINHSCEPNAYIDTQKQKLIASKCINPNEEITFNYLVSEREITAPFDCNCSSENCAGRIERKPQKSEVAGIFNIT